MTINAHFINGVIVPDEPLDLPANQAMVVMIEPTEQSAISWLAIHAVQNDNLPTDLSDRHDHYLYGAALEKVAEG